MAEGRILTWENQVCVHCEGETFVAVEHLRVKPGGGTIAVQVGWQCAHCGRIADIQEMQRVAALRQRRKELLALEAELEEQEAARPPSAPISESSVSN